MPDIIVPELIGLTQAAAEAALKNAGLTVGAVKKVNHATIPEGNVSSASPAATMVVASGSVVSLEVSSGPGASKIAVPSVIGLTLGAAEDKLKSIGLAVGQLKTQYSDTVPTDGVAGQNPSSGMEAKLGDSVELHVSSGKRSNWTQRIPPVLFAVLGFMVVCLIGFIIVFKGGREFLNELANKETARGLITFVVAISTVGIAIILAISTVLVPDSVEGDKRFDRGKQVLSVLMGVLGTIIGFYFGATPSTPSTTAIARPAFVTTALPDGASGKAYPSTNLQTTGLSPPLKWSVKPALPSGLELNATNGAISGTPTAAFPKTSFTFTVTDSATPAASMSADINLEIK